MSDENKPLSLEEVVNNGKSIRDIQKEEKDTAIWIPSWTREIMDVILYKSSIDSPKELSLIMTKFGIAKMYDDLKEYNFRKIKNMLNMIKMEYEVSELDSKFYKSIDDFNFKLHYGDMTKQHIYMYEDVNAEILKIADMLMISKSLGTNMALLYAINSSERWISGNLKMGVQSQISDFQSYLTNILTYLLTIIIDVGHDVSVIPYKLTFDSDKRVDITGGNLTLLKKLPRVITVEEVEKTIKQFIEVSILVANMIKKVGKYADIFLYNNAINFGILKLVVKDYPELIEMVEKGEKDINKIFEGDGIND